MGRLRETFGQIMKKSLAPYRDELFISTKAGHDMWEGPYGIWNSRKHLMASIDQSLKRMNLEYVDIFIVIAMIRKLHLKKPCRHLSISYVRQGSLCRHIEVS